MNDFRREAVALYREMSLSVEDEKNLVMIQKALQDAARDANLQLSEARKYAAPVDAKASIPRLKPCEHSEYWTTHYGNCMACRAVDAERLNGELLDGLRDALTALNQVPPESMGWTVAVGVAGVIQHTLKKVGAITDLNIPLKPYDELSKSFSTADPIKVKIDDVGKRVNPREDCGCLNGAVLVHVEDCPMFKRIDGPHNCICIIDGYGNVIRDKNCKACV